MRLRIICNIRFCFAGIPGLNKKITTSDGKKSYTINAGTSQDGEKVFTISPDGDTANPGDNADSQDDEHGILLLYSNIIYPRGRCSDISVLWSATPSMGFALLPDDGLSEEGAGKNDSADGDDEQDQPQEGLCREWAFTTHFLQCA